LAGYWAVLLEGLAPVGGKIRRAELLAFIDQRHKAIGLQDPLSVIGLDNRMAADIVYSFARCLSTGQDVFALNAKRFRDPTMPWDRPCDFPQQDCSLLRDVWQDGPNWDVFRKEIQL